MNDRKPGAIFWVTMFLVAVLPLYPLSFGPVVYFDVKWGSPQWWAPYVYPFYEPLDWLLVNASDNVIVAVYDAYMEWCVLLALQHKMA